jgi:hypothetical protein
MIVRGLVAIEAIFAVAEAPEPPPPVKETVGAEL